MGHVITINGVDYECHATLEVEYTSDGALIYPLYPGGNKMQRIVKQCPECHGVLQWETVVYDSWEAVVEAGWATPVGDAGVTV
jgi:hypothetical protein